MKKKEKKKETLPYLPRFHLHASVTPSHTEPPSLPLSHTLASISPHLPPASTRQPLWLLNTLASSSLTIWFFSFISLFSFLFFYFSVSDIYHESTIWLAGASSSAIFRSNFFVSHCIFQHLKWVHFTFLSFLASFLDRPKPK